MKKITTLLLILVMVFSLSACSKDSKPSKKEEEWLDKATAEKSDGPRSTSGVVTEVHDDYLIIDTEDYLDGHLKLNGDFSDGEFCVDDDVTFHYKNIYTDKKNKRIEGDVVNIDIVNYSGVDVAYKPVIYLYPEQQTEVSVKLDIDGGFICTYPEYNDGWKVVASPDGTLTDQNGMKYNYLYWEGKTATDWDMSKGFCVKGEDTARFLEDALSKLGLTRREANEFIVYWLPLMQNNPYNIISFQTDVYTDAAKLKIAPNPDTLIRVFMAFKASDAFVEIDAQSLTAPQRLGFTAVEWGGTKVK